VTPLAGVPGINSFDTAAQSLCFVCKERSQLRERPGVQTPLGFSPTGLDASSDVREVFDNDDRARRDACQDALAENMVAIPSEPLRASREEPKAAFGRLGPFGLQRATAVMTPMLHLTPRLLAVEAVVGGDGRAADPQVNPEGRAVVRELHVIEFEDDVEREPALAVQEVGGGGSVANQVKGIDGDNAGHFLTPCYGGEVDSARLPIQGECVQVKAGRAECGGRASDPAPFLVERDSGLDGLRRLLPGLDVKIGDQFRAEGFAVAIGEAVKREGVAFLQPPAFGADKIERLRELAHRLQQAFSLLRCGVQGQPQRPVHASVIAYEDTILQQEGGCEDWDTSTSES